MAQEIRIDKKIHAKDAVIIALQKYLDTHWVRVLGGDNDWVIEMEGKAEIGEKIDEKSFYNELVEAEFLALKDKQTADLRRMILKKALSPYSQG